MIHEMKLNHSPFNKIKEGTKNIEMRLYDEKRRLLMPGDNIKFTNRDSNDTLLTEVIGLYIFKSFDELYKHFEKTKLGYDSKDIASSSDMEQFYSKEEQSKYGVVGIEIKLL